MEMENQKQSENPQEEISAFEEVKNLTPEKSLNVLIQAAEIAQKSGGLSIRDAVIVGGAIEFFTSGKNQ